MVVGVLHGGVEVLQVLGLLGYWMEIFLLPSYLFRKIMTYKGSNVPQKNLTHRSVEGMLKNKGRG